jgi:hypothetical protein
MIDILSEWEEFWTGHILCVRYSLASHGYPHINLFHNAKYSPPPPQGPQIQFLALSPRSARLPIGQ